MEQLPLKHTGATVAISGVIADVQVRQTYVNNGEKPLEATYVFPASTRAAVYAMKMTIGERVLSAVVREKEEAREMYEQAKEEGKSTSLLEQERPNVFTMNVANIMPGDTIHVDLRYTELLVPENGMYAFVYPTVTGPRYAGETKGKDATANARWVENPYTREGEAPAYSFDLTATVSAGMPIQALRSNTHDIDVRYKNKTRAVCSLAKNERKGGNRDFILQYRLSGDRIESGLLLQQGKTENFFLAMLQPPERPDPGATPPREYIFVMDVSGSMHGFPLNISKSLMEALLEDLSPQDRFNVLFFAGGSTELFAQSQPADSAHLQQALKYVSNRSGSGGTNLLTALKKAFSMEITEDYSRSFVILTDGFVSVERETFQLIREKLSEANVFTFGIGSSVNRYIIEGMARAGMGKEFVATSSSEASVQADLFKSYIEQPVLTNISYETPGFETYDIARQNLPDVFAERPVLLYGKWKGKPRGTVRITGRSGTQDYQAELNVNKAEGKEHKALKYLWARDKIRQMDDYARVSSVKDLRAEIVQMGLKYNLLTRYTSFVAIDSLVRNDSTLVTVKQPLPLPKGVTNHAMGSARLVKNLKQGRVKSGGTRPDRPLSLSTEAEEEPGDAIYYNVEQMPEFPGGMKALKQYLKKHLEYPEEAKKKRIEGKVYVRFCVNTDGSLSKISVVRGVDPLLDHAALKIIKKMARTVTWKPGKQIGKPVKTWFTVPVEFSLEWMYAKMGDCAGLNPN